MSLIQEFKAFAMRGNVVDMAVGIIIGGAFGKIVGSLVTDVIMPPIGILLGNVDFSQLGYRAEKRKLRRGRQSYSGSNIGIRIIY